ncbi:UDP-2,3-diacylglucosamine hydrolase [Candidatus Blochmanniella pennsylvanica str. BPEN]|uniref:UDP-2,3-diacylglucosamine hydrolase n=1 Tax=Blochmanniella pennsylvanica (strain BPEN) TaxID=291272 RepID=LPXH_BLOPB|nr:UDP-2,3-diacylglucosamine diphosphatase [Candidatus Blochmannia pennsylvanicus]Q493A2.1 RecName: Full=UDP-2,3-diacylglucosamine hydrolase; AltName: Full=UDP-2,3-diacylglucosamine diphosphatase [Candidatus Blochmannia pennsylvanicus str. BPEN]AAZ40942.1 UDP-2,3-diacylglucosamine hydrolase [Candidatus Blochmannia pennsylvanicus str. BPEN]
MSILFISDVHLSTKSPYITDGFLRFLSYRAMRAKALYILGDLFETWLGDDDYNLLHINIAKALKALNQRRISCYFIHGNHDFLLGQRYARACGMTLLSSNQVLKLASGKKIIILHGDILCANDNSYQLFRKYLRHIIVQRLFLSLPLSIRSRIFSAIRSCCVQHTKYKSKKKLNINLKIATDMLIQNNADIMIHGHTHQPAIHKIYRSKKNVFRIIVLGCWNKYGSMIEVNEKNNDILFTEFPLYEITKY